MNMTLSQYTLSAYHHSLSEFPDAFAEEASIINVDLHFQLFVYIFNLKKAFSPHSNFLSFFKKADHGNVGIVGSSGPIMSSSIHRRSLQDVEALGLFHHGRGPGRHLTRQSSDDPRRRSTINLQNAASVTHLAGKPPFMV